MNGMSETDWAYLAGIIDGEGYIGLNRNGKSGGHQLRIAVKSTCHELLTWLRDHTGVGSIREIRDHRPLLGPGHRSPVREWRAFTNDARDVLNRIQDLLKVKREQARIAVEYQTQSPAERRETGAHYHAELMRCNGRQMRLRANAPTTESSDT